MHGDMLPTSAILGTTAVLGGMAALVVFGILHMRRVRESWSRVASRRGWSGLDDARGTFGISAWGASMRGLVDGTNVVVETVTRRSGKHRKTFTRVRANLQGHVGARVRVQAASWLRFELPFGMPRVELEGSAAEKLCVHSDDARVARELVTSSFLRDWERLARAATLEIDRGEAALEWHGIDANEERIERAIDLVVNVSRATRETRVTRCAA